MFCIIKAKRPQNVTEVPKGPLLEVFFGQELTHAFAIGDIGLGATRSGDTVVETIAGSIGCAEHGFGATVRFLPAEGVGDGDSGCHTEDIFSCADKSKHPTVFLTLIDERLNSRTGPFTGSVLVAIGDDGDEDSCVFDIPDIMTEALDGRADGIKERSLATWVVLLWRETVGILDGRSVVDHLDATTAESGERDEMVLGIHVLELSGADGAEGLVVAVDGFAADRLHGAGFVEDNEVVNLGFSSCFHSSKILDD